MPNYQANTVNTIVTLAAPHAKAPISFDADIVDTYQKINDFWKSSYSRNDGHNSLSEVTLISIAGGGLDTVVPSDYSTVASLVPLTNGFTVFTSSIANVWTGMDHLAITWCDQLRKSLTKTLYGVVDARRASQTVPRAQRMEVFEKGLLTGLEHASNARIAHDAPTVLLTLPSVSLATVAHDRLVLRGLGSASRPVAYLMPVPSARQGMEQSLVLLTNQLFATETVQVLACSTATTHVSFSAMHASRVDMSENAIDTERLICQSLHSEAVFLPASTAESQHAFDDSTPFQYLQLPIAALAEHEFVAIIDAANSTADGWLIAEFIGRSESVIDTEKSMTDLLRAGVHVTLPPSRPIVTDIRIPPYNRVSWPTICAWTIHVALTMPPFSSDPYYANQSLNLTSQNSSSTLQTRRSHSTA
ncbi:hypothetical protein MRB53_040355 [Persea americana]|nr:hypothetical protein MRB53_040355 [Persea americana]